MNRLIENARKRAWHLAILADSASDLDGRSTIIRMNRVEVNQMANTINALQVLVGELLEAELLRLRRETPVYMYRTDPSRPEKTLPFHRMHAEACVSALAMGLQMTHILSSRWTALIEETREADRLRSENEDFLTMRDDAFKGRRDAEAENVALREQVEEWKRKYKGKIYSNE